MSLAASWWWLTRDMLARIVCHAICKWNRTHTKSAVEVVFKITALTIHPNLIFAPPSKLLFSKGLAMSVKDLQVFWKDSIQHM